MREQFADWRVYLSPELTDSEYAAGHALQRLSGRGNVHEDTALHLAVSMRIVSRRDVSASLKRFGLRGRGCAGTIATVSLIGIRSP